MQQRALLRSQRKFNFHLFSRCALSNIFICLRCFHLLLAVVALLFTVCCLFAFCCTEIYLMLLAFSFRLHLSRHLVMHTPNIYAVINVCLSACANVHSIQSHKLTQIQQQNTQRAVWDTSAIACILLCSCV